MVRFKRQWYLFLHNAALSIGDLSGGLGRRAVPVEHLAYDEDGLMRAVTQTEDGVTDPPTAIASNCSRPTP